MSTVTHATHVPLSSLRATARGLALGLFWAAAMLIVLALWVVNKHRDLPGFVAPILYLLAAVSAGLGVWQALTAWKRDASEAEANVLSQQRGILAKVFLGGGLIFMVLGLYLGIQYGLAGFGESVGLIVLGLGAALAGRILLSPPRDAHAAPPFLEYLQANPKPAILFFHLMAGVFLVTGVYLWFIRATEGVRGPQASACFALAAIFIGQAVWLMSTGPEDRTINKLRTMVLLGGGLAGLFLFLATVVYAILERDVVFFGGLRGWLGEEGWKVWLVGYVGLGSLAMMFGSLLLARGSVRTDPLMRRALYGYNTVLNGMLLFLVLAILNIVFYAVFPYQFDWTKNAGLQALHPRTKALLAGLQKETTVYAMFPRDPEPFLDLLNLLDNCQRESPKFQVKWVSPDLESPERVMLAARFPNIFKSEFVDPRRVRGMLVVYGDLPADVKAKVPHAFMSLNDIYEMEGRTRKFKGEAELMKELNNFVQERKRKIYVLQGNGELNINESREPSRSAAFTNLTDLGSATLFKRLGLDRFDLQGLSFGEAIPGDKTTNITYVALGEDKKKKVPDDAEVILVLGPTETMAREDLDALDRYLDGGGKMIAAVDVVTDRGFTTFKQSGLEDLLKKRGVLVGQEFLITPNRRMPDPTFVVPSIPATTRNDLAKAMGETQILLKTVRPVRPDPTATRYTVDVLLHVDQRLPLWAEGAPAVLSDPIKHIITLAKAKELEKRFSREPIPVAVAVTELGKKPQLVVFGDAEFVSNSQLRQGEQMGLDNYGWLVSALEYLNDRPTFIGPAIKETSNFSLAPGESYAALKAIPGLVMALVIIGLGMCLWMVRRR